MIWATISSRSCFSWKYRASPSLAAKNRIWFGIDHLVMSVYRVISWVVGKGCLLWPARSLDKSLLAFSLLHFVLLCQPACYSRYILTYYFCNPIPYDEKDIFILVLVLETVVCLHRTIQLHLLQPQWLGINLDYCDVKWLALEIKWDHFLVLKFAPKYCILDSFDDC